MKAQRQHTDVTEKKITEDEKWVTVSPEHIAQVTVSNVEKIAEDESVVDSLAANEMLKASDCIRSRVQYLYRFTGDENGRKKNAEKKERKASTELVSTVSNS